MKNYFSWKLPRVGQRIVRSVCAVLLCFVVYYLRGQRGIPFYSALAVLQCIQPYNSSTKKVAKKRLTGTFVGAVFGLIVIILELYTFGGWQQTLPGYLVVSLATGVVLYTTVLLDCKDSAYFSCVVFLSIAMNHIGDTDPFLFVLNRVVDTLIGVAIAITVNSIHLPQQTHDDILFVSGIDETILSGSEHLSPFSKIELNRLIDDGAKFTISTNRTPASVREAMEGVNLKLPIIAMNGAVLYDMNEQTYLMKYQMSSTQANLLTDFLNSKGIGYFTNTIMDDTLVIYYNHLDNEALEGVYQRRHKSCYRNYVKTSKPVTENVIYYLLIEKKERTQQLYEQLNEQAWAIDCRIIMADSENYSGYAYIKIYHKDATRENMLHNLQSMLNIDKTVSFGSISGQYDVLIKNTEKDEMVRHLKHIYEPIGI